jgi:hypothetical protein
VLVADIDAWHPVREEWVEAKMFRWWTSFSGDVLPHAVRDPDTGRVVLRDGHHRIERERRLGRRWTWVRLWEP